MVNSRGFMLAVAAAGSLAAGAVGFAPGIAAGRAPAHAAANGNKSYFAGWVFPQKGATSVTSEFVLPTLQCTSTSTGAGSGSFIYTNVSGKDSLNAATVALYCFGGRPVLVPAVQLGSKVAIDSQKPFPGDLMKATVMTSFTATTATIQDLTKGHTFTLTKSTTGAPSVSAEIGTGSVNKPNTTTVYPITNFGSIHVFAAKVNGKPLGATPGRAFDMVRNNVLLVQTGPLTGGGSAAKHNAFTSTWKHS